MKWDMKVCTATQFGINELRDVMSFARSTKLAVYVMLEIRGILKALTGRLFVPAIEKEISAIKAELKRLEII